MSDCEIRCPDYSAQRLVEGDFTPTSLHNRGAFHIEQMPGFGSTYSTGKWCVTCSAAEVDTVWAVIHEKYRQGKFPAIMVSTPENAKEHGGSYVICVFTRNWADKRDVDRARAILKDCGVTQDIGYKRDIETFNNVYGIPEEWFYRA